MYTYLKLFLCKQNVKTIQSGKKIKAVHSTLFLITFCFVHFYRQSGGNDSTSCEENVIVRKNTKRYSIHL